MEIKSITAAFERHQKTLEAMAAILPEIQKGAKIFAEAVLGGGTVFMCGNGGSAADAQHLAAELLCRYKDDRKPLPAMVLIADPSTVSAIGNDYAFEKIFARPLDALGKSGDLLVAFTTSGSSPDVLRALEMAKVKKMRTIVLTGAKGERLKK